MKKRIGYFLTGALILAIGLTLNTKSALGISSINTVPFALSLAFPLTLGNFVTLLYTVFIIAQLILLRAFSWKVVAQLPFSVVFGLLVDLFQAVIPAGVTLAGRCALLLAGIPVTALGAALMVKADLVLNPADGIVAVIARRTGKAFGTCKNFFDIFMCLIAAAISLLAGRSVFETIGIGTILSALLIGRFIALLQTTLLKEKGSMV